MRDMHVYASSVCRKQFMGQRETELPAPPATSLLRPHCGTVAAHMTTRQTKITEPNGKQITCLSRLRWVGVGRVAVLQSLHGTSLLGVARAGEGPGTKGRQKSSLPLDQEAVRDGVVFRKQWVHVSTVTPEPRFSSTFLLRLSSRHQVVPDVYVQRLCTSTKRAECLPHVLFPSPGRSVVGQGSKHKVQIDTTRHSGARA